MFTSRTALSGIVLLSLLSASIAGGLQRGSPDLGLPPNFVPSNLIHPGLDVAKPQEVKPLEVVQPADTTTPSSVSAQPVANVQVQRDFPELTSVVTVLDQILADLLAQDKADNLTLANAQNNYTASIASSAAANTTLESAMTTFSDSSSALSLATSDVQTAQAAHDKSVAEGIAENTYITNMETALTELEAVGSVPNSLIQISVIANQLSDKGVLAPTALVGRGYPDQTSTIRTAIATLKTNIAQKDADALAALQTAQTSLTTAQSTYDAAVQTKSLAQSAQQNAFTYAIALSSNVNTTTVLVQQSIANTAVMRAQVYQVKYAIASLSNTTGIITLQIGDGAARFQNAKATIEAFLTTMESKVDIEFANESQDKLNKYSLWNSALALEPAMQAIYDAKMEARNTLDGQIATATVLRDTAQATIDAETTAQVNEEGLLTQLTDLLTTLGTANIEVSQSSTASAPTTKAKQLLLQSQLAEGLMALQVGTGRDHSTLIGTFTTLVNQMRGQMATTKLTLAQTLGTKVAERAALIDQRPAKQAEMETALTNKMMATISQQTKKVSYESARDKLANNDAIRTSEKALLTQIRNLMAKIQ